MAGRSGGHEGIPGGDPLDPGAVGPGGEGGFAVGSGHRLAGGPEDTGGVTAFQEGEVAGEVAGDVGPASSSAPVYVRRSRCGIRASSVLVAALLVAAAHHGGSAGLGVLSGLRW
ncbi:MULTISPECIES: hypothetical protein [Kitasatospora]|uniref:Uncharacterized protein n=1 Tax=Kitasatospora cathayae TaxID=3004092 RepID=A0ABY7QFH8_9ACTN|nr:hypothetical protein [Kitasatospora sp. HUAS 3-15]WBP90999.1 hypothetical protein O1G21_37445 [Kitasatospora sp. HUAS 3-15]